MGWTHVHRTNLKMLRPRFALPPGPALVLQMARLNGFPRLQRLPAPKSSMAIEFTGGYCDAGAK